MDEIGEMDQRITFQTLSGVADGGGGETMVWTDFADTPTVWAKVVTKSGSEGNDENRVNATATTLFTVRNRSDVSEVDRIKWEGSNYDIRSVRRFGTRKMRLVIEAERGV